MKNPMRLAIGVVFGMSLQVHANEVTIVDASIVATGSDRYRVSVTLEHADTGWDHYANRWDVLDEAGKLLGSRELLHPHVEEQPFTRSLTLQIPSTVKQITIVANDSVHGLSEQSFALAMPK